MDEFLLAPVRDWLASPVAAAAAPPVGEERGALVVRRRCRRAARESSSGEPGSPSGDATEHGRE